jgi:hypothetical protein
MYALNIFGVDALPRTDIPETEIAKLSPEQSAAFFALMTSYAATVEADIATREREKAKGRAETALKKQMAAYEAMAPKRTFFDEWKKTVAGIVEPPIDPDLKKKMKASMIRVDEAHAHLAECEKDINVSKKDRQAKRKVFTNALVEWSKLDGTPKNVGDLVRARHKTESEQQLANIAAGMPADYAAAQQSTVGPSHLDRFKSGQGKGHSVNQGYLQNKMRGATVKVPSER